MAPSAPVMVQPSWVHTASTAVNALSLERDTRNTPAFDWTSAAPPTLASGEPLTVTCTLLPEKRPAIVPSGEPEPPPLGEVDEPLQPVKTVINVALDAAAHAPAQN